MHKKWQMIHYDQQSSNINSIGNLLLIQTQRGLVAVSSFFAHTWKPRLGHALHHQTTFESTSKNKIKQQSSRDK